LTRSVHVRVPASSANLGPGFDALGLALSLPFDAWAFAGDEPPAIDASIVDDQHPVMVAFRYFSGEGRIAVRSAIPPGRGLGYSGAARVAGLLLAAVQHGRSVSDASADVLAAATKLEGHPDNVAASLLGGVVVAASGRALRVPLAVEPGVVVWIPSTETSTDASRAVLPTQIPFADAVFNVGRTSLLIAALVIGDTAALRDATADRLHQDLRLRDRPASRAALRAALEAGAWCAWLSGSGPSIAALAPVDQAAVIAAALPVDGEVRVLAIDTAGAKLA
jgi:homoserine kinase